MNGRDLIQEHKGKAFHMWIEKSSYEYKYTNVSRSVDKADNEDNED
eukprot:CAMPEP_0116914546 /NCGR_PEP_ID=MMETSP0467-20121206/17392_1 /TAXON_ID=283647 /ORGANISM="Mesodinium pulex, Strain SPMC105" /LENGTH=45 /DNA_ID= /DNA_START= /DNA_END= /DNA_ORIENTATION=